MIDVQRYKPEHLRYIALRERDTHIKEIHTGAVTLLIRDKPIAILGGSFISSGVFQVWGLISDDVRKCPISFHRTALSLLHRYADVLKVRRLQMTVRTDYKEGYRWARALGFIREGKMESYSPDGSACYLFGRVV